ncbi:helix-turn-helix domain-containing protein [Paraneptunicella aestuarii]|uniref:helix-turn-helix domain-containing protein n=1 Tax=Paraneptunicella aestuarii TaxID=2831148 RepID=UPI001E552D68|nr:helix-turn-helix domain-containing protein [Paraneptunicella aestuarii]UAA37391.1 helix-turn-helix domain-containing protein [Paraneptunicella aestuarii]
MQLNNKAIVERMRQVCLARNDAELAKFLGTTTSAVSTWKNARYPPYNGCLMVHEKVGATMDWLLTGIHPSENSSHSYQGLQERGELLEVFINKFMEAISIAKKSGLLAIANNAQDAELHRLGQLLFNEYTDCVATRHQTEHTESELDENRDIEEQSPPDLIE